MVLEIWTSIVGALTDLTASAIPTDVWVYAAAFKTIPLSKILIETDAPYLSPEPLRGKSNEPSNVVYTAKYLSNLKDTKFKDFCDTTSNNFFKLFGNLNWKINLQFLDVVVL